MTIVNLIWWIVGGGCVLVALIQIIATLSGPKELRGRVIIGVLLILIGTVCLFMPAFGEGGEPPVPPRNAPYSAPEEDPGVSETSIGGLSSWHDASLDELLDAFLHERNSFGSLQAELTSRFQSDLSDEDILKIVQVLVDGDGATRPPSDAWRASYGSLLKAFLTTRALNEMPIPDAALAVILDVPPIYGYETRTAWPQDVAPIVQATLEHFWPADYLLRLEVTPRDTDLPPASLTASNATWEIPTSWLTTGEATIVADIVVQRLARSGDTGTELVVRDIGTDVWTIDFVIGGTADETLPAVTSDAMSRRLSEDLEITVYSSMVDDVSMVVLNTTVTQSPLFTDIAFGGHVCVRIGTETLVEMPVSWAGGTSGKTHEYLKLPTDANVRLRDTDPSEIRLVFRSDDNLALRAVGCSRRWTGEVDLQKVDIKVVATQ